MKSVAIIIVNYNGWRDTIECLESLRECSYPTYSVYVVDNGSKDESVEQIRNIEYRISNIKLLITESNLGFSGGNNVGIKKALEDGAEYVLLLNNDTVVSKDFLTKLVGAAEGDLKIGIVGPKIYFADESGSLADARDKLAPIFKSRRIWFGGGKLNWLRTRGYHLDYGTQDDLCERSPTSYKLADIDYITGCCLLIKREVIDKIGLMPEDYFLYYEDVDWCLRAKQAGYRVMYTAEAYIWHKVSRSTAAGSISYVYYHVRNGLMLAWRFGGIPQRMALVGFVVWTLAKQVMKLLITSKSTWARAALGGVKDFLSGKAGKAPDAVKF